MSDAFTLLAIQEREMSSAKSLAFRVIPSAKQVLEERGSKGDASFFLLNSKSPAVHPEGSGKSKIVLEQRNSLYHDCVKIVR